jgi:endonuclease-8
MPEGDVLHRVAALLQPLVGERLEAESPHPRGRATGVASVVDGRVLQSVEAVGKHLLLRFEGGVVLRSHLRMTGRWRVGPRGAPSAGLPWLVLRGRELEAAQWNGPVLTLEARTVGALGPDVVAASTDVDALVGRLRAVDPGRLLGAVLLDQRVIAGLGTMWIAETLWQAGVQPWLTVGETTDAEVRAALEWARATMRRAVAGARPPRAVYRRAGRPCRRCGALILSRGLGDDNRRAYWCPGCQRGPVPAGLSAPPAYGGA